MSAINPASFVTPTVGLQPPSGIGPGALAVDRDHFANGQSHKDPNTTYNSPDLGQANFDPLWNIRQDMALGSGLNPTAYAQFYHSPGLQEMFSNSNTRNTMQAPNADLAFASQAYGPLSTPHHRPHVLPDRQTGPSHSSYANRLDNWGTTAFQDLSLGS